ncbi:MAG: hypothetical protein ACRBI6_04600 [Acidimicrobiales bacterium]
MSNERTIGVGDFKMMVAGNGSFILTHHQSQTGIPCLSPEDLFDLRLICELAERSYRMDLAKHSAKLDRETMIATSKRLTAQISSELDAARCFDNSDESQQGGE